MSQDKVRKTRFTPSESSAGHGLPPQRAPKQCPAKGVRRILRGLVSRHGLLDTVKKHTGATLKECFGFSVRVNALVAHDCGYPLSRYTCCAKRVAADFLDFVAFCRCSSGVSPHPLKILVSHLSPPHSREVSHRNLGLKRCRATRGCRSYSCGCRATLCN